MGCKSIVSKARRGLSLVELVVVLVIVAIIAFGFGSSAVSQIKRTNRETVVNELQVLASNFSDAYYDLGNPDYDPSTTEGLEQFKTFLNIISSEYIMYSFDFGTLEATDNGFYVEVSDPVDVWEQRYCCWFVTKNVPGGKYVMVASGGDDGIVSSAGYASNNYSDDIVLVVKPKIAA